MVTTNVIFLLFFLSVGGILGRESLVVFLQLSQVMAEKREEPLSKVRERVNGRIVIAVARSYSQMIRGSQFPSTLQERDLDWDP